MRRRSIAVVGAGALLALGAAPSPPAPSPPTPAATAWLKAHAVPFADPDTPGGFDDLRPLKKIIGDARIVALGEATHGTHEFFAVKRRLVEFLAREMGFTHFALEANLPEAEAIGEYVRTGRGDPVALTKALTFWTVATDEMTDLVRWMRSYREAGGAIDFAGIDIQLPAAGEQAVLQYLRDTKSELLPDVGAIYARLAPIEGQFGLGYAETPATELAGQKVTLKAWVRTADVHPSAVLHLRANDAAGNLIARARTPDDTALSGTRDWTELSVSLDLPPATTSVRVGFAVIGSGTAWFDDARLTAGERVARTLTFEPEPGPQDAGTVVLDPRSQAMPFALALDAAAAHGGGRSLRIGRTGDPPLAGAAATDAAARVVARLAGARAALVAASSPERFEAALHLAEFVRQGFEWQADATRVSREVSMAENLKWILDRAPAKAKVIVWAHNGHVSRDPDTLGSEIEKRYPGRLVTLALTASAGKYQAERPDGQIDVFALVPPPAGSLESFLETVGRPRLIVDMRPARAGDPGSGWLTEERPMRYIGVTGTDDQFVTKRCNRSWDGVIWFADSRPSMVERSL